MNYKRYFFNFLKFLLFLSVGVGILYVVYRKQASAYREECVGKGVPAEECSLISKVIQDFAGVDYFWILMVLLAFTFSNVSRALRWNMLIRQLGYQPKFSNSFLSTMIGYFANLGLPRLGEVVRAGTMAQYERIAVEKVMGTIVADRVLDVICILLITGLAFLLQYDIIWQFVEEHVSFADRLGGSGYLLLYLALAGLAVLGGLYAFRRPLMRTRLFQKIAGIAQGFLQGIQTVRTIDRPGLFLLHTANIWFMYYSMTYLCFFAYEPTEHLPALAALVVYVFGGWGIVIPSPGGMGTYHFLAQTALMMYGVSGEDGFSWANISFFSIQIGCNIFVGILALILLPIINRNYHPQTTLPKLQKTDVNV